MAEITAVLVKALRERTGAGMMDCKKALVATQGDNEAAVDWLRKQGLASAAKKAGRVAAQGLVGVAVTGRGAAVIEVNSETDFVARNTAFQDAVDAIATLALDAGDGVPALESASYPGGQGTVADALSQLAAIIGENIRLRRVAKLSVAQGIVATYVHGVVAPNLGRIGVLTALESTGDAERLSALGKGIAMHVAAARPEALTIDDVAATARERERAVLTEQARESGKPENIIEMMVEGRLRKYYEEVVLLEQIYVVDGKSKISDVVDATARDIGAPIRITGFVRFALGEGIE